MTAKIIYFTAGDVPTSGELADIAALNAFCDGYSLTVSNGAVAPNLGADVLDDADFVAGTVPALYDEVAVIDPDAPFATAVGAGNAIVADEDELTLAGSVYTFTVEDGAITAITVEEE